MTARAGTGAAAAAKAAAAKKAKKAPLSFETRKPQADPDLVPLFELDGTVYTMPVVDTGDALQHLAIVSGMSEAMAGMYLLRNVAGPDAFNALIGKAKLDPADWRRVTIALRAHVFGDLEAPGP